MDVLKLIRRTRYRLRTGISHIPWIYLPLAGLRNRDAEGATVVTRATDLVVEAYPRSGNTFAVMALQRAQPQRLDLSHHTHASSQLIRAVRLGIPALLIIRQPKDAVLSFVLRSPVLDIETALRSWIHFHRSILPWLSGVMVTTFEQVTSDMGDVISHLNARFDMDLSRFDHTAANVDACFKAIEMRNKLRFGHLAVNELGVARPSSIRGRLKLDLEEEWMSAHLQQLRDAAAELYTRLYRMAQQSRCQNTEPRRAQIES